MDANQRLTSLESTLEGRERIIAWFKKAQAVGGFFDYCNAVSQLILIEDEESAFLFHLVNRCNGEVLEITSSRSKHLFAIYLVRLEKSPKIRAHEVELHGFRGLLLDFVVEGLALQCTVDQVCQEHFGETQLLFSDLQEKLAERNQAAKQLLKGYNAFAPKVGFALITDDELQSAVSEGTAGKTDELVRLSRAEAVAKFGNIHEARELLLPLIDPSTDNSKTR